MDAVVMGLLGVVAGAASGSLYFGGLAATVRRLPASSRPAVLVATSLLVRLVGLGAVLLGLALWATTALLAGVAGLLLARTALVRRGVGAGALPVNREVGQR